MPTRSLGMNYPASRSPMDAAPHKQLKRVEGKQHARLLNFACFHNKPFLSSDRACRWTLEAVSRSRDIHGFRLWAYVLMPDHVHLLIWPGPEAEVSRILSSIKLSVTKRAIRWATVEAPGLLPRMLDDQPSGRACHRFWQRGGGYDRNLWSPDKIWDAIDYIHINPVRAGHCAAPAAWRWSSASFYLLRQIPSDLPRPDVQTLPPDPRR